MLVHHRIPSIKSLGVLLLPPGWDASPSQDTQHEITTSITVLHVLPPGWNASPLQDTQRKVTRSITTLPWMGC